MNWARAEGASSDPELQACACWLCKSFTHRFGHIEAVHVILRLNSLFRLSLYKRNVNAGSITVQQLPGKGTTSQPVHIAVDPAISMIVDRQVTGTASCLFLSPPLSSLVVCWTDIHLSCGLQVNQCSLFLIRQQKFRPQEQTAQITSVTTLTPHCFLHSAPQCRAVVHTGPTAAVTAQQSAFHPSAPDAAEAFATTALVSTS